MELLTFVINAVFNELKFTLGAIPDTYIKLLQV
jgi:hypothetical protein